MKNYKSLDAHNYFISGWVQTVYHMVPVDGKITVFKADVKPSFRVNHEPHHPWAAVSNDGSILTAHYDCMAGLGESCSHVGALLFKIEAAVRNGYTRLACTDVPCEWNQCFVKKVKAVPIASINFYKETYKNKINKKRSGKKPGIPKPSEEQQQEFLRQLGNLNEKPVGLSLFTQTAHHFTYPATEVTLKRLPLAMTSLYNPANKDLSESELSDKCDEVISQLKCTTDEVDFLTESTGNQSKSVVWHEQRVGRITASIAHSVLHTNIDTPAQSLIKTICHPKNKELNTEAIKWGHDHEKEALEVYKRETAEDHSDFVVQNTGLHICESKPYIGATPDALSWCSCCGKTVVEVKCPFKHKDDTFETMLKCPDFCLNSSFELKTNHRYYAQVQLQMFVLDCNYCDFVVWTTKETVIRIVHRDHKFIEQMVQTIQLFWKRHCLPELLTRRKLAAAAEKGEASLLFCYCNKPDDGSADMIGCDDVACKLKWFHYTCAKVKRPPKGAWYCKECRRKKH